RSTVMEFLQPQQANVRDNWSSIALKFLTGRFRPHPGGGGAVGLAGKLPAGWAYLPSRLAPYLDRACLRSATPSASSTPRMMWWRTPGRSRTRPPRTSTIECSCRLCPSPGMYAVTSTPLDSRTRATLRSAEFGFFGVMILTCKQTPRFCGQPCRAGCFGRRDGCLRGLRTSWFIVGIPEISVDQSPILKPLRYGRRGGRSRVRGQESGVRSHPY